MRQQQKEHTAQLQQHMNIHRMLKDQLETFLNKNLLPMGYTGMNNLLLYNPTFITGVSCSVNFQFGIWSMIANQVYML